MVCTTQQVPDEFERILVGIQSYIGIRRHFDDIAFSVFETDEGHSPNKKVLMHEIRILTHWCFYMAV
jgi:nuclear cap-binding protein subunit 1